MRSTFPSVVLLATIGLALALAGCAAPSGGGQKVGAPPSASEPQETTVACSEPIDMLSDSDCMGTRRPRKLRCASAATQRIALRAGCTPEDPEESADHDVCCPLSIRGSV